MPNMMSVTRKVAKVYHTMKLTEQTSGEGKNLRDNKWYSVVLGN